METIGFIFLIIPQVMSQINFAVHDWVCKFDNFKIKIKGFFFGFFFNNYKDLLIFESMEKLIKIKAKNNLFKIIQKFN